MTKGGAHLHQWSLSSGGDLWGDWVKIIGESESRSQVSLSPDLQWSLAPEEE